MEVMKPRTKKGPSWANDDINFHSKPELSSKSGQKTNKLDSGTSTDEQTRILQIVKENDVAENDLDDIEWMKRRMTKVLSPEASERVFEQDEDDDITLKPDISNTVCRALTTLSCTIDYFISGIEQNVVLRNCD